MEINPILWKSQKQLRFNILSIAKKNYSVKGKKDFFIEYIIFFCLSAQRKENIMNNYDLDTLKMYLPQYVAQFTEYRKNNFYNCPFCGSGTGANGTPAFHLYEEDTKFKCHSCGVQGTIIDFYLMIHKMGNSQEETTQAIKALSEEFCPMPFPVAAQTTSPKIKISERQHIYKNADGSIFGKKIVNKFSDGSKNAQWILFNQETGTFNSSYGLGGQKAPLYNADYLKANYTEPVYIVEGEKDADTLTSWSIIATTFPNGAGFKQWIPLYNEGLQGHDVIIITDNDDSGRQYGNTIAKNLLSVANTVKIIPASEIWNECPEKGDITDISETLGKEKTQELLKSAIEKTEFYTQEQSETETHVPIQEKNVFKAKKGYEFERKEIRYVWYPYIPAGDYTVLMAAGGTGKTYFACGVAATVSRGEALPVPPEYASKKTISENRNVLIISAEDRGSDIWERLEKAGADVNYIDIMDKTLSNGLLFPKDSSDETRIENFENIIETYHPNLIIIDPWHAFCPPDVDVNRINHVRPVFQNISAICEKYDCGLILISHINKKPQDNANNAALGSVDFVNASRSALTLISDSRNKNRRIVVHTKINHASYGQSVGFTITDDGFAWDGFEQNITKETLEEAARMRKKPVEMIQEAPDYSEMKNTLLEIITELTEHGKETKIAYRQLENMYDDEDFHSLHSSKKREVIEQIANSEAFRSRGMTLKGYITNCKYQDSVTGKTGYGKGIIVSRMVTGEEMTSALPK